MPVNHANLNPQRVRVAIWDEYATVHAWLNEKVADGEMKPEEAQERMKAYESGAKSWAGVAKDGQANARLAYKLARDMKSLFGRVYFKTYKGAEYVIIKGLPSIRQVITGTRYKTTHPMIKEFQIGRPGLRAAAKDSFIFGVILVSAIDIFDYFMRDSATLGELCGNLGMDIAKVAIASTAGYAAGAIAAATVVGTFALGPLVVGFLFGVAVGYALDKLDEHFKITDRLCKVFDRGIEKFNRLREQLGADFEAKLQQLERSRTVINLCDDINGVASNVSRFWREVNRNMAQVDWRYVPL